MKRSFMAVIGLYLLLYILPLGVRPIVIPDEFRYAEIPREMLASGDWAVPHLNGVRYFEKPVLGYWINAVAIALFGENAFAIRFPSAMAVGISALLILLLVRRFGGGYSVGIMASVVFLTCMEVFAVGVFSILDGLLSMFITGAMVLFFFAHREVKPAKKTGLLALFGLFCGLAFLTKGFLAFALPVLSIIPFMIWEGRKKELFLLPWVPIAAALLIALPWCVMIHLREPDFWHYLFWIEHVKRFMSDNPQHSQPFWFFIPIIIGGALPWAVLIPAAILGLRETGLKEGVVRFAICWFLFPFLFFSASHGKLGTYILPCFPPLAILITLGLVNSPEGSGKRLFRMGASVLAVGMGVLGIALILSQVTGLTGFQVYGRAETWKWVLLTTGLLVWSVMSVIAGRGSAFWKKFSLYCTAPVLFMLIAHFVMPDRWIERKAPGPFLIRHSARVLPDTTLVSDEALISAVCWCYKRDDVLLLDNAGELAYGLGYDDAKHHRLAFDQLKGLVNKVAGEKRVVLITRNKFYEEFRYRIPKPSFKDTNNPFVFIQY